LRPSRDLFTSGRWPTLYGVIWRSPRMFKFRLVRNDLNNHREIKMDQAQLIHAAASIAGGMAAAHYDKFSGLVASRVTEIAETAVRIARAIEIEAAKKP
jgi:hypothetical protein